MADNASDLIKAAEAFYGKPLTADTTKEIRKLLEAGIARALGLLANIIMCDYLNRWNEADENNLVHAKKAVDLALYFTADEPTAHYAQAFIHRANGKHQDAHDAFAESLKNNPGSVRTRAQMAAESLYLGDFKEALEEIDQAIIDGASSPALGMFQWIKGRILFFKGLYEKAIPCLQESVNSWEDLWYNRLYLVSAQAHFGEIDKAKDALTEFRKRFQGFDTIADVITAEGTNPNDNPAVIKGREAFHDGLMKAGISPK